MTIRNIYNNDEISLASLQRAQVGDTIAVVVEEEVTPASEGVEAKTQLVSRLLKVSSREGKVGRATGGTIFVLRDIVDERQKLTVKSRGKLPKNWIYVRRVSEGTNARAGRASESTAVKAPRAVKAPKIAPAAQEGAQMVSSMEDIVESI